MAEEELTLEASLKSLEISSCRLPSVAVWDEYLPLDMNPFQRRPRSRSTGSISTKLNCTHRLNEKSKSTFKRNSNKLLKDPILKSVSNYSLDRKSAIKTNSSVTPVSLSNDKVVIPKNTGKKAKRSFGSSTKVQTDFKSLLDGCERLSIGTEYQTDSFKSARSKSASAKNQDSRNSGNSSCSQEAIVGMHMNAPCDVTMDELASYFETFVHIPKKMSSMAEMMYI